MNITVDMGMLRCCRLDDVLKWITTNCITTDKIAEFVLAMVENRSGELTVPVNQYTASIIARACHYDSHYWKMSYMPDIGVLVCCDNINDINSDDCHWCPVHPDPFGNVTEWSGDWVVAQLEEIHAG